MNEFRRLMWVALISGAVSGVALFAAQQWTVLPLIEVAERYEAEARASAAAILNDPGQAKSLSHSDEGWHPDGRRQQTLFTALASILTGIAFAAALFGTIALAGARLTVPRGALWGVAGFACFVVAPALGLPPEPPGVAVADLKVRQLWWVATVAATAVGLWLLAGSKQHWLLRAGGATVLLLPHAIGAPVAGGQNVVPLSLIRRFMIASLATQAMFWLLLGIIGGLLYNTLQRQDPSPKPLVPRVKSSLP